MSTTTKVLSSCEGILRVSRIQITFCINFRTLNQGCIFLEYNFPCKHLKCFNRLYLLIQMTINNWMLHLLHLAIENKKKNARIINKKK